MIFTKSLWSKYCHGHYFTKEETKSAKLSNEKEYTSPWHNQIIIRCSHGGLSSLNLRVPGCEGLTTGHTLHLWRTDVCPMVTCISQAPCYIRPLSAGSSGRCHAFPLAWWWSHGTAPSIVWLCPLEAEKHGCHHFTCQMPIAGLTWTQTVSSKGSRQGKHAERWS